MAKELAPELKALQESLVKPPEWHEMRRGGIGGSDANIIMNGSEEDLHKLWLVKTGQAEGDNLDDVLPVQMGTITEDLNLYWLYKVTGQPVYDTQKSITDEKHPFLRATLDGKMVSPEGAECIVEAKHTNAYSDRQKVTERYMPQLQHNMRVTKTKRAILTVFFGNMKHDWWTVDRNIGYQSELLERQIWFWKHVEEKTPPFGKLEAVAPPPQVDRHVSYDMSDNNEFVDAAETWREHKKHASQFEAAKKALKEKILAKDDAAEMTANGIQVKVSTNGSVRISGKDKS